MPSPLQTRILKALFVALRPLARALLRSGLGYREFAEVAKAAFVDEASTGFGLRGRATNISRVAVMTGVARKEVKSIRENGIDAWVGGALRESPASIVLSRWATDSRYLNSDGCPLELDYDGSPNSFVSLVRSYAGDIPPGAMRTELKRVGAIEQAEGGKLRMINRHFVPLNLDDKLVIGLEDIVGADLETLSYNCDGIALNDSRYHRVTSIDNVDPAIIPVLKKEAEKRLVELADSFDSYLSVASSKRSGPSRTRNQVGIGMFYYQRESEEDY